MKRVLGVFLYIRYIFDGRRAIGGIFNLTLPCPKGLRVR